MSAALSLTDIALRRAPGPLAGPAALARMATLSDLFAAATLDASAVGFVQAVLPRGSAPILWVQDRVSARETGSPYLLEDALGAPVLRVALGRGRDVLQALEDGLGCRALAAVVGEVWGDPPALDFTATKRLALRAERAGRPCWLIRRAAAPNLSAARNRWRVGTLPSLPHPDDARAPGMPRWRAELFRSRAAPPGVWSVTHDRASDRLDFSALPADGTLAQDHGPAGQRAAR